MAAISDPRALTMCNTKIRPLADLLASAYYSAERLIADWNAQQMGNLIPFTADVIRDTASPNGVDATGGDGRPIIRAQDAEQIYNLAVNLLSWMQRGTLDGSGAVNNASLNNVLAVKVNGQAIF